MAHSSLDSDFPIISNRRINSVENIVIRELLKADNPFIAKVIRTALEEFGVARPGTVYTDPTTDDLFQLFTQENSRYFIAEHKGSIVGGCGIFPTKGLPEGTIELVKLYVNASARNLGVGRILMEKSIQSAKELGYHAVYLETMPELGKAITLYERLRFQELDHPLGESGHYACDLWMIKHV
jgi:putative acetyltransferase